MKRKEELVQKTYPYRSRIVTESLYRASNNVERSFTEVDESIFKKMLSLYKKKWVLWNQHTQMALECERKKRGSANTNPECVRMIDRYLKLDAEFKGLYGDFYDAFVVAKTSDIGQKYKEFDFDIVSNDAPSLKLLNQFAHLVRKHEMGIFSERAGYGEEPSKKWATPRRVLIDQRMGKALKSEAKYKKLPKKKQTGKYEYIYQQIGESNPEAIRQLLIKAHRKPA